ncbi:MAG: hypothetical protein P4L51_11365 [Puia sp.]|nr:hypothetical protein [Puia sp.]
MINRLIDLTRELLGGGAFSHLPDDEVSRLHWNFVLNTVQNSFVTFASLRYPAGTAR